MFEFIEQVQGRPIEIEFTVTIHPRSGTLDVRPHDPAVFDALTDVGPMFATNILTIIRKFHLSREAIQEQPHPSSRIAGPRPFPRP